MEMTMLKENLYMSSEDSRDDTVKVSLLTFYYTQLVRFHVARRPTRSFLFSDIPELYRRSFKANRANRKHSTHNSASLMQALSDPFKRTSLDDLKLVLNSLDDQGWKLKNKLYSDEEYEIVRKNFLYLFAMHRPQDGARLHNGTHEVHKLNVKQFFLDCSISSLRMLDVAMCNIQNLSWVNLYDFTKCVEEFQKFILEYSTILAQDPVFRANITMQLLLFFFRFVDVRRRNLLDKSELDIVLSMASKKKREKQNFTDLVNFTFSKVEEFTGEPKFEISFEEFEQALHSSE
ncbi:unnamed protein product [Blepharisma stoltei]|uniref:EF-hand domain-containing protein n=1 Tax=Blepharisma stoltei TaxID=1481888 RepID=A0AAU9JIP1_9CILI|nr:unnamed protein product [Blepharisma stoltei]